MGKIDSRGPFSNGMGDKTVDPGQRGVNLARQPGAADTGGKPEQEPAGDSADYSFYPAGPDHEEELVRKPLR